MHNAGRPPEHMPGIRRLFRSKPLNSRHQQTFTNHTRKGINRIQIQTGIFLGQEG